MKFYYDREKAKKIVKSIDPSGGAGTLRAVGKVAVKKAAPIIKKGARLAQQELRYSETAMRKRWDSAAPAARKYINKGLVQIRKEINKYK